MVWIEGVGKMKWLNYIGCACIFTAQLITNEGLLPLSFFIMESLSSCVYFWFSKNKPQFLLNLTLLTINSIDLILELK